MTRIMSMFSDIPGTLIRLLVVLFSLTVHEVAHAYAAYKMGDPTARSFGRLSLNPIKHIDPLGFLCMFLFGFGWAKPVPINARYFKKPREGMAITALAGPVSNILMSFFGLVFYRVILAFILNDMLVLEAGFVSNLITLLLDFLASFYTLNLYLGIFNLIPIPPLDGSRVLFVVLPDKIYFGIMKYEKYIQAALLILLWFGWLNVPLTTVCGFIFKGMNRLLDLIPFLRLM